MSLVTKEEQELGNRLYETYAKPLEADHYGEYIAIASDGKWVLGPTAYEAAMSARRDLGEDILKVGERVLAGGVDPTRNQ
jgi:hypothetical protein